jgi:hypothetical protein
MCSGLLSVRGLRVDLAPRPLKPAYQTLAGPWAPADLRLMQLDTLIGVQPDRSRAAPFAWTRSSCALTARYRNARKQQRAVVRARGSKRFSGGWQERALRAGELCSVRNASGRLSALACKVDGGFHFLTGPARRGHDPSVVSRA